MVRAGKEPNRIGRVIDYLEAHFAEDVEVNTLAAVACLSPYHFIRVFSKQTGMTPHAWLMQLRVRKAVALLNQDVPIAETALQTGFSDQSHLNRLFKRYLGYTPGQLRNSVQDT
jgi:transcriptional regulator GlxA family with amidase domain